MTLTIDKVLIALSEIKYIKQPNNLFHIEQVPVVKFESCHGKSKLQEIYYDKKDDCSQSHFWRDV